MKLEFESGLIPDEIYRELDFEGYLSSFEKSIPAIPHCVLRVLSESEAEERFNRLAKLDSGIDAHGIDTGGLLQKAGEIPSLGAMLPFFQKGLLEPFHLFDLGRFLKKNHSLEILERAVPVPDKEKVCRKIHQDLMAWTTEDFTGIKCNREEVALRNAINLLEEKTAAALSNIEQEIFRETGLKLIYPYPREVRKDDESLDRIDKCRHLELKDEGAFFRVDYHLNRTVEKLVTEQEKTREEWARLMEEKLKAVNKTLSAHLDAFLTYYEKRKQRLLDYAFLAVKKAHGLCFPEFVGASVVSLKKGCLPVLMNRSPDRYNPLDLELNKGVNLLFGANMTGKTTVLKTLYFHLALVKFGLPVPAESFSLPCLNRFGLQLKSSGDTGRGLSGFADELRFFSRSADPLSVFLVDEMFHSTDPVNGVSLSEAFLEGLRGSENIYLCTSHYPEVLNIPGVRFLKMKDFEGDLESCDLDELLESVPYEVEEISAGELKSVVKHNKKPLQIALHFSLPETIKKMIRKKLRE